MKWHSMHYGNRSSLITNSDYDETIIGNICVRVCVCMYMVWREFYIIAAVNLWDCKASHIYG